MVDASVTWWIVYRIDADAIVVLDVFAKKTQATPKVRERCLQSPVARLRSDCGREGVNSMDKAKKDRLAAAG
ncbi:MAG: hypothetical protein ACLQUT_02310 [Thermoleophilia bacterium]